MPYKVAMQRRTAIKLLAGAFIGQALLSDGRERIPGGRHAWLETHESGWLKDPYRQVEYKRIIGVRNDGVNFYVVIPRDSRYGPEGDCFDIQNGWDTLNTFLDPDCRCRVGARCRYHEKLLGPREEPSHAL